MDIVKIYTAEQLYTMYRNKILADNVGLTDFNAGSKVRSLLESNSEIISSIAMDFKEALYKAIPVALYDGFGFEKKAATYASGFLRLYRIPALYISYSGAGTAAEITSTNLGISATVTGAPGDNFSFLYAAFTTIGDIVTQIDALGNWAATLVKTASIASDTLYQYTSEEVIGATNYLNGTGLDLMLSTDAAISIPSGFSASIDQQTILTTATGTLLAGDSSVTIAAENQTAGLTGNLAASAIDTLNGKGSINSSISGVEHIVNDTAFSGGAEAETDQERATRFSQTVNSLNAGTKNGILAALQAIDGVRSVGMRVGYPSRGNNTILIDDGSGSGVIDPDIEDEAEKVLYGDPADYINYPGKNAEGIGYIFAAPTIQPVNVTIEAIKLDTVNIGDTTIITDVKTAIEQYINTRGLGQDVIRTEIIRVAKDANASIYDVNLTVPASNVSVSDAAFAKTGAGTGATVTVTVSTTSA